MTVELSIVVPVYNNSSTLKELITKTNEVCYQLCGSNFEVCLIDDGSVDDSWNIIQDHQDDQVFGIRLSRNFGQHSALKAGFANVNGKYTIMMDADLEDDPATIGRIYKQLTSGFDICFTNFVSGPGGRLRRTSRFFQRFTTQTSSNLAGKDIGTMRGFSEKVRKSILRFGERRPVYGPLISSMGYDVCTVDVMIQKPKGKNSSYSFMKRLKLSVDFILGYTNIASRFFTVCGGFAFLAAVIYAAIIFIQYFFGSNTLPPGLSLIVILMLILFAVLFFGVGIIGLYLQRLLEESLERPLYLISNDTRITSRKTNGSGETSHVRRD